MHISWLAWFSIRIVIGYTCPGAGVEKYLPDYDRSKSENCTKFVEVCADYECATEFDR